MDEGSEMMTRDAYNALSEVAGEKIATLGFRSSFAMIGFSDKQKPSFVKHVCSFSFLLYSLLQFN